MRKSKIIGRIATAVLVVMTCSFGMNSSIKADETENTGYVPMPWEENVPSYESPNAKIATSIPSSYMNNIDKIEETYPKAKDQGEYGTCWAFSGIELAEFQMINKGEARKTIDLSELALAYFTYNSVTDPLGGTKGDKLSIQGGNDFLSVGGNLLFGARGMFKWQGPIAEKLAPYDTAETVLKKGIESNRAYNFDEAHLENMYLISRSSNASDIKKYIMENGAVGVQYYASGDESDFKKVTYSPSTGVSQKVYTYYCPYPLQANHVVVIVGWDDNFSKSNFKNSPGKNGAWLVRNSWADSISEDYGSYFWLSYYDKSLQDAAYVYDFGSKDNYDYNYQYDGGSVVWASGYTKAANIFTVNSSSTYGEKLEAVNLSFINDSSVSYKIKIYTDLSSDNPYSGVLVSSQSGVTKYAGMYTIKLKNPVLLNKGSKYAVVVETSGGVSIDSECDYNLGWGKSVVSSSSGQSMYYSGNTWKNKTNGNFCIKAYTNVATNPGASAPAATTIKATTSGSKIKLSGNSVACSGYEVEMATVTSSDPSKYTWSKIYTGSKTSYTVTGCKSNTIYGFRIRAYNTSGGKIYSKYKIAYSDGRMSAISVSNAASIINLKWNKVQGATGYVIMRSTNGGSYKALVTISSPSVVEYEDSSVSNGTTYSYKVVAKAGCVCKVTSEAKTMCYLKPVKITSITNPSSKALKVSWSSNTKAAGYQIKYSRDSSMAKYKTVKITNKAILNKTIKSLTKGKKYYVKVRAYKSNYYSVYSAKKSITIKK